MDTLANLQFSLAAALATALIDSLWQNALLALLAAGLFGVLGPRRAALRHTVGMFVLLAMVAIPVLSFIGFWALPAEAVQHSVIPAITAPSVGAMPGVYVQRSSWLANALSLAWLLGAGLMLLRHFGGWRLVEALDRQPHQRLPVPWQRRVQKVQDALGIGRHVAVRLAGDIASPFTARWLRPVIWLPVSLLTRLPSEQVEALIAHELAHIRRHDWLWNGLQCVAESLLFYHPAASWLGRRIRHEREHACDDMAVAACGNAIALAEALAGLERHRDRFPRLVLAAHGGSLMQRITRLLTPPASSSRGWLPVGGAIVLMAGTLLVSESSIANRSLPHLRIEASTDGKLGPGDRRQITARGLDGERVYQASVDAQGRLTEVYTHNGEIRPMDAQVRSWVKEMVRMGVPPLPPPPPAPPAPPAFSTPPPPPAPPPPEFADAASLQALSDVLTVRADVIALLGSPVPVEAASVRGEVLLSSRIDDTRSEFAHVLVGPVDVRALT